jgi:hypothetical protein
MSGRITVENLVLKAGAVVVVLIFGFFLLRFFEKKNLYFPLKEIETTPADIHLEFEDISLTTDDRVQITGWFVSSDKSRGVVLFCHGNGGNISHRLEKIKILNNIGLDVFIFDYRGYGRSSGRPFEEGLYLDAEAAYTYLHNQRKVPSDKIILYGESLGGAVAVDLATNYETGGIIIEGSFTSVPDMAKRLVPFMPSFILSSRYNSYKKIANISSPILIIHSADDEIVPFEMGRRLFNAAPEPKEFVELKGGHNDAFLVSQETFIQAIDAFLGRLW